MDQAPLMRKAVGPTEMSIYIYHTTRCHFSKGNYFQGHCYFALMNVNFCTENCIPLPSFEKVTFVVFISSGTKGKQLTN